MKLCVSKYEQWPYYISTLMHKQSGQMFNLTQQQIYRPFCLFIQTVSNIITLVNFAYDSSILTNIFFTYIQH